MKEYWVNVYDDNYCNPERKWYQKPSHKYTSYGKVHYRLHVREFDTREAKELYLALKYPKYNSNGIQTI